MAQKGKRQDWDGDDTHCICIRIHHACMSEGGTVIALPLLTEYMTQALYRHMLQLTSHYHYDSGSNQKAIDIYNTPDRPHTNCYIMRIGTIDRVYIRILQYTYINTQLCTSQAYQKHVLRHIQKRLQEKCLYVLEITRVTYVLQCFQNQMPEVSFL